MILYYAKEGRARQKPAEVVLLDRKGAKRILSIHLDDPSRTSATASPSLNLLRRSKFATPEPLQHGDSGTHATPCSAVAFDLRCSAETQQRRVTPSFCVEHNHNTQSCTSVGLVVFSQIF
ncbi:unnamed protein product [Urochloa humidicola]